MSGSGRQRVLIVGGGVAALEAALALRDLAADRVAVELLAPESHFWYRPGAVAVPFQLGRILRYELGGLARRIGADFTPGALVALDSSRHVVHTSQNAELQYDQLLIACGAVPSQAVPGALTFRGPADIEKIELVLAEIARGEVRSVAFAIPWGAVWSLPAYELALLTATHLESKGTEGIELTLVTPESKPLQIFGDRAGAAVSDLLAEREVALRTDAYPTEFSNGELRLLHEGAVAVDRVVALPRLRGAPIDGLPQTVHGFVPVDAHCRVEGFDDLFAAGDVTTFTVKQGGIATQQADAAAETIAAAAGVSVTPQPFRPVLRGLLLTGVEPRYLRRELSADGMRDPDVAVTPLWWPPSKIVGRYLGPFLASLAGVETTLEPPLAAGILSVESQLDADHVVRYEAAKLLPKGEPSAEDETVTGAMSEPLVVAPEDTLGEVADLMLGHETTAVAVSEYGRLVGIVTRSDLLRAYAARAHPSEARVRVWMTAEPVTVTGTTPLEAAVTLMREYDIAHLPIIEGERPVGMLGLEDALRKAPLPLGLGF